MKKKIKVDDNISIVYFNNEDFQLHIRTWGPAGAVVYHFEGTEIKWRQSRVATAASKKTLIDLWNKKIS
tara:strand:+ start:44 stop:250 length:207 start_codon:yes stop_codon:yes gene_type:complete